MTRIVETPARSEPLQCILQKLLAQFITNLLEAYRYEKRSFFRVLSADAAKASHWRGRRVRLKIPTKPILPVYILLPRYKLILV